MIKLKNILDESMFPKGFNRESPMGPCELAAKYATEYLLSKGIKNFKILAGEVSLDPDDECDGEEDFPHCHVWIRFKNGRIFKYGVFGV